ncbi:hypothetical protein TNCV_4006861 [Trichonephila clavipes]|nr:hypothetical protein TNCV_4006861 [Trichonephila clavipes]
MDLASNCLRILPLRTHQVETLIHSIMRQALFISLRSNGPPEQPGVHGEHDESRQPRPLPSAAHVLPPPPEPPIRAFHSPLQRSVELCTYPT